ncbi:hypothetical protein [Paenibacillus cremeus]|uniref:Uncharacterized protein n=1 Tax=Paenibacillus cremeus TaxID=2163881 RepID=A0A559KFV3_9BACL|nr:hypothetical protein [Paenibacillus cremeus]TVY10988.1 hypothetical protein FPZ49_05805 [Paenibacillus cremeus]
MGSTYYETPNIDRLAASGMVFPSAYACPNCARSACTLRVPMCVAPGAALRHKAWKLIEFFEDGRLELYNLETDIGERVNQASALPEKTRELHVLMLQWREAVGAPMPLGENPLYGP